MRNRRHRAGRTQHVRLASSTRARPPHRLLVLTKGPDDPDEGAIEVTLTVDGDETSVVWEERGRPLDFLAAYGAGIQIHLEDLADHVAGGDRRDPKPRFDALFPTYQELAATVD
jgi:hypothetical protein